MPGWPQKEQEGFGTDLSPSFWGVPATSIPSRPWGCTPGAAGGGRGALGPPWAAAARLQGGGLGGARWWPQHLAGLISGSLFPASPFPPCLQIAAPWGGFLVGGTRRGGGSVLPAHLNLARFLSNSCFSRWKSWMYFIWGQRGGRGGLSARGRGTQTPTAPLPPMGAPQPWDRPYSSGFPPQSPASIPWAAPEGHQPWARGHRGLFSAAGDKPNPGGGSWGNQAPSPRAHGAGM